MLEDAPTVEVDPDSGGPSKEAMEAVKNLERAWPDMQDRVKKLAEAREDAAHKRGPGGNGGATGAGRGADGDASGIGTAAHGGWLDEDREDLEDYYELTGLEYLGVCG